jgi:hypothetical protein
MLAFDAYSGDYGSGFWGYATNTATYMVNDPELGWLAFGGNLKSASGVVTVTPRNAFRSRLYVAPAGLWITLDAGAIREAWFDTRTGIVRLTLDAATEFTPEARLRIEQAAGKSSYVAGGALHQGRGAYLVPLGRDATEVVLRPDK